MSNSSSKLWANHQSFQRNLMNISWLNEGKPKDINMWPMGLGHIWNLSDVVQNLPGHCSETHTIVSNLVEVGKVSEVLILNLWEAWTTSCTHIIKCSNLDIAGFITLQTSRSFILSTMYSSTQKSSEPRTSWERARRSSNNVTMSE